MLTNRQRNVLMNLTMLLAGLLIGCIISIAVLTPLIPPLPVPKPVAVTPPPQPSSNVCIAPIIPYGSLPANTHYSTTEDQAANPFLVWRGVYYYKVPGKDGRLWGIIVRPRGLVDEDDEVLLYAKASGYCQPLSEPPKGTSPKVPLTREGGSGKL